MPKKIFLLVIVILLLGVLLYLFTPLRGQVSPLNQVQRSNQTLKNVQLVEYNIVTGNLSNLKVQTEEEEPKMLAYLIDPEVEITQQNPTQDGQVYLEVGNMLDIEIAVIENTERIVKIKKLN